MRFGTRTENRMWYTGVTLFAITLVAVVVFALMNAFHVETYKACEVTGKDRTTTHNGDSDMRVYSSCGTFQVSDSLLVQRFDSADAYGKIKEGQKLDIEARGYRVPIFNMFPNIQKMDAAK